MRLPRAAGVLNPKHPPSCSPRGASCLAVLLPRVFLSCYTAASPTPKLFSWAAKSGSQKLGNILVRLLYNAAVNYMLTCLFVPASFSVDVDGPSLISNYSVVCFLLF